MYYGASDQPAPDSDFGDVLRRDSIVVSDSALSTQLPNSRFAEIGVPSWNWGLVYKIMMGAAAFAVLLILIVSVKKIDKVNG